MRSGLEPDPHLAPATGSTGVTAAGLPPATTATAADRPACRTTAPANNSLAPVAAGATIGSTTRTASGHAAHGPVHTVCADGSRPCTASTATTALKRARNATVSSHSACKAGRARSARPADASGPPTTGLGAAKAAVRDHKCAK